MSFMSCIILMIAWEEEEEEGEEEEEEEDDQRGHISNEIRSPPTWCLVQESSVERT